MAMNKILSAKNKKMLITGLALLAGIILIATVVRATKAGAKTAGEIWKFVSDTLKPLFSFGNVVLLMAFVAAYLVSGDTMAGVTLATSIGTLTTGAGVLSTFNTTYVPKTFLYTAATQLTGVKITVQGDGVIFDSDANGLNHCGVSRIAGQITNTYTFRLTNGFIPGKNVIWEFTNSAAQTPIVYVSSDESPAKGQPLYLQLLRQAILANSGQNFSDFATLSFPSIAATDVVNVLYRDGTQQQLLRNDIQGALSYVQNVVNTPVYTIDNYAQMVKLVNFIGGAQTAYVQRWVPAISGGMLSQTVNQ
jgi:hypothetical protein